VEETGMFRVELYGNGKDGTVCRHVVKATFATLTEAIETAECAAENTYSWGRATAYRLIDASGSILFDAKVGFWRGRRLRWRRGQIQTE
jgi:hypothetical protein